MPVYVNIDHWFLHRIILFSWRMENLQILAGEASRLCYFGGPSQCFKHEKVAERLERSKMSFLIMDVMIAFSSTLILLVGHCRHDMYAFRCSGSFNNMKRLLIGATLSALVPEAVLDNQIRFLVVSTRYC